jgi:hypothetical protein
LARAIQEAGASGEPQRSAPRDEIAVAQAAAGDFSAALASARSIGAIAERAVPLAEIAAAMQTAGRGREAAPVFAEAIQAANATPDGRAWSTVKQIAQIQAAANLPAAVATFDLALQMAPSQAPNAVSFLVADARAEAGETAEALRDAQSMSQSDKNDVMSTLATTQAAAGNIVGAWASAQAIADVETRISALAVVVLAQIRASKMQDAATVIAQMQGIVANNPAKIFRPWLYAELAGVEGRAGLAKQAAYHVAAAREATAAETDPLDHDRELGRIAIALARAGQSTEAVAMAASISPTYSANLEALEVIAREAEEDGDYSAAARAMLAISNVYARAWYLVKMAAKLPN